MLLDIYKHYFVKYWLIYFLLVYYSMADCLQKCIHSPASTSQRDQELVHVVSHEIKF